MLRSDFKQVIKCVSIWRIDKRKGNYKLPNGDRIRDYLAELVGDLLTNNRWGIAENGNVRDIVNGELYVPFKANEPLINQDIRVIKLINEMLF